MLIDILFCIKIVHFWNRELHNSFFYGCRITSFTLRPELKKCFSFIRKATKRNEPHSNVYFSNRSPHLLNQPNHIRFYSPALPFPKNLSKESQKLNKFYRFEQKERANECFLSSKKDYSNFKIVCYSYYNIRYRFNSFGQLKGW